MNHLAPTTHQPDMFTLFRQYAASVRRDKRLSGESVHTLTLQSELESKDSVTLDARIERGVVTELGYRVRACSLAQAVTGILAARTSGITVVSLDAAQQELGLVLQDTPPDKEAMVWPELLVLQDAAGIPERHEVALLPIHLLQQLLAKEEG